MTHLICKLFVIGTKPALPKRPVLSYWGVGFWIFLRIFPHLICFDWIATRGCSKYEKVLLSSSLWDTPEEMQPQVLVGTCQLMLSKQESRSIRVKPQSPVLPEDLRHNTGGYFEPSVLIEVGSAQQFLGGPQSVSRPGLFFRTFCTRWTT